MSLFERWRGDPFGGGPIRELRAAWCAARRGYWSVVWAALVRSVETLNHPYHQPWPDAPETHWGPLSGKVCDVADRITRGWCHD